MHFTATDVFDYFKPSPCVRRVALRARGVEEQKTDTAFRDLLRDLGARHEAGQLATLPGVMDLSSPSPSDRERLTLEAIRSGAAAIYQPRFRVEADLDGEPCELVGEPDFLVCDTARGGYLIRDSKLAHHPLADRHAGIPLQLQIYGYLYERAVGEPPLGLEVHAGTGEIVSIPYAGEGAVVDALREHRRMRRLDPSAYEPVGWTKCGGCGYEDRCRKEAEAAGDVALLARVPQEKARELHRLGIRSIAQIAPAVEDPALHDYFWTGKKSPRHKDFVEPLLLSARARLGNRPIFLEDAPALPDAPDVAMFDLEGLPPYLDELDRVYLWGLKVYGGRPSAYLPAQAGFGHDADREGWFAFLRTAARLFADYGPDLPFVHWSSYERTRINLYLARYGDLDGVTARILANLVDLLTLLKKSVVLPLPSYSLKVVDAYVGFRRARPEADGAWSIAKYIEATESGDPAARQAIVSEILAYNEEDLDASHAVMEWLVPFVQNVRVVHYANDPN